MKNKCKHEGYWFVIKHFGIFERKYNFDDKMIYDARVKKVDVPKGEEFIRFKIEEI